MTDNPGNEPSDIDTVGGRSADGRIPTPAGRPQDGHTADPEWGSEWYDEAAPVGDPASADVFAPYPRYEPQAASSVGVRIGKVLGVLLIIALSAAVLTWAAPRLADIAAGDVAVASLPIGEEASFVVPTGATASGIAAELEETGLVATAGIFERAVRTANVADQLKAGEYVLVGGMSTDEIIEVLVLGPPPAETYRVTIIEGLRMTEILEALAKQTPYTVEELRTPLLDGSVTSDYLPDSVPGDDTDPVTAWEGLLFPATYDFLEQATATRVLQRLSNEMETRMARVDWSELEARGLTPYDGIIIASLIEKEAKLAEDRPLISSVIENRIEENMRLQIDATVIYALGENPGRVLDVHLETDSPWNTYRNNGLPPTPIGAVRDDSLEAAAQPGESDYLFYVVVDENGGHGFSETIEEHQQKIDKARADGILP